MSTSRTQDITKRPQDETDPFHVLLFACDWRGEAPEDAVRLIRIRELPLDGDAGEGDLLVGLPIKNLELLGSGVLTGRSNPAEAWHRDGVLIRIGSPEPGDRASAGETSAVVVSFEDGQAGETYSEHVTLEPDTRVAVVFQRSGSDRALAVALFPKVGVHHARPYLSAFKTDRFTLLSHGGRVRTTGEEGPVTFEQADVVIPEHGEQRYLLRADRVTYSKRDRELTAHHGALFDVTDQRRAAAETIRIRFEDDRVEICS